LALGRRLVFEGDAHRLLATSSNLRLESVPGETWSFWTYDPAARVTVEGVRWPVENAALDAGGRPSISNEAIHHEVSVRAEGGAVIVMRQHDASI